LWRLFARPAGGGAASAPNKKTRFELKGMEQKALKRLVNNRAPFLTKRFKLKSLGKTDTRPGALMSLRARSAARAFCAGVSSSGVA
jgi:hypothetical protein